MQVRASSKNRSGAEDMVSCGDDLEKVIYKKYAADVNKRQRGVSSIKVWRYGVHCLMVTVTIVSLQLAFFGYQSQQSKSSQGTNTSCTTTTAAAATTTTTGTTTAAQEGEISAMQNNVAEFTNANAVQVFKTFMLNPPALSKVPYNGIPTESMNQEKSNSQVGQDTIVDQILKQRRNGFFIEAGAYDGVSFSNSLFFELHRNWTGLLVEANPRAHRELLQKDRKAWNTPACISTSSKVELGVDFLASGMVGGYDNPQRFDQGGDIRNQEESDPYTYSVKANCFPLNIMLEAIGVNHVDMFSLDVEGVELKVLKAIDFDRVTIDLFVIETNGMETELKAFMQTKGYQTYNEPWSGMSSDIIFLHESVKL